MRILMAMHSLAMGGAEKFFTNLACGLHEKHNVTCYIPALHCSEQSMRLRLPPELHVESIAAFTPFFYRVFYKLTLLIQQRFPDFDPEMALHTGRLRALYRRHKFDVVNAHLMPAARQVCTAFEHTALPLTKSDHGDTRHPDPVADAIIFRRLDALVCPAEANARAAKSLPFHHRCRISTIPYGYRPPLETSSALPHFDGITFGMVARGVADKGWRELIAAARRVHSHSSQSIRLVLIGEGPCIQQLRSKVSEPWIIFAGQQNEAEGWVRSFDIGLLPTCLPEESLPNSIIEYLACGKPVIASAVGGIPKMVGKAGLLVPLAANGRADVDSLAEAMLALCDGETRAGLQKQTQAAFQGFDMGICISRYEHLFHERMSKQGPSLAA